MEQQVLEPGEVIFREGEESQEAYRILSGKVQISVNTTSGPRVLSHLYPGEIFGEMGMVDDQPRSATAIAAQETTVEVIAIDSFIKYVLSDSERLSAYLGTVFERLRASDLKLQMALKNEAVTEYIGSDDHSLDELFYGATEVAVSPDLDPVPDRTLRLTSLASDGDPIEMTVDKFPFRIGRLDVLGDRSPFGNNDLSIPDGRPFQISRNHCSIDEQAGRFFVRDRGSTLGTIVNDKKLGADYEVLSEELVPGENTLILGAGESAHRFSLAVS